MESKRKTRKVLKARSVTREQPKSPPADKPTTAEALIIFNGNTIESLMTHEGWKMVEELIDEGVASVSGRKTNGYYYNGAITGNKNKDYLTGYQEALTQLYNRIKDYIKAKENILKTKKLEEESEKSPLYNPFMEEENDN